MSFNIGKIMKQAQEMQKNMAQMKDKLEQTIYEGTSGGGMAKVTINGNGIIKSVKLDKSIINPEDPEMLEDLVMAAFNDAKKKADSEAEGMLSGAMGGMPLPPGMKFPF
ncbi:MAG: YbaB/EbfC family nucleoid-associated protein [Sphingobacteriia bacterium]|nr:YbaB/EbfC family nucleoid-associated protein [Sphingobacteriia bacterium]